MCCFTGNVQNVSSTSIFARGTDQGRQILVYSMNMTAAGDVAMVLPLPVPPGTPEDGVRFINLENDPTFFQQLMRPFETRDTKGPLPVQSVGSYEASFVPTRKDFERLDPRFRLADSFWEGLPIYQDYGFAVFKLKADANEGRHFHPMAFEFPRRNPEQLFFPTVHVHDGEVHDHADFDHYLFCQADPLVEPFLASTFQQAPVLAVEHMNIGAALGVIDGERRCYFKRLKGLLKNQDTVIGAGTHAPGHVVTRHFSVHDFPATLHGLLGYTVRIVPPNVRLSDEFQQRRVNLFTDIHDKIFDISFG